MKTRVGRALLLGVLGLGLVLVAPPTVDARGRAGYRSHRYAPAARRPAHRAYRAAPRGRHAILPRGRVYRPRRGYPGYYYGRPRPYYVGPRIYWAPMPPPVYVGPRVVVVPSRRVVRAPVEVEETREYIYYDGEEGGYEEPEAAPPGSQSPAPTPLLAPPQPGSGVGEGANGDALDASMIAAVEQRIVGLVNEERAREGLPPLVASPALAMVARRHSGEMYALGYFSHTSPVEGHEDFTARMREGGIEDWGAAGENIAMTSMGSDAAERLVQLWMDSQGHRENILRPEFRYIGVGVHGDGDVVYATQLFASKVQ